jgi:hypothetical protein
MDKRIPARALIECILCAHCNNYATATGGGICAACAITAERDQLRAENERLKEAGRIAVETWRFAAEQLAARCDTAERERDEALAHAADLRGALEDVLFECDGHSDVDDGDDGIANIPNMAMRCEMIIDTTLARTPAQSLGRVKAEELREAAGKLDSQCCECHEDLLDEADRLEATDGR